MNTLESCSDARQTRFHGTRSLVFACLCAALLAACGGGGGPGGPAGSSATAALFQGDYWRGALGGRDDLAALTVTTAMGDVPADGVGSLELAGVRNRDGALTAIPSATAPYVVTGNHGVSLRDPLSPASETYAGGMDPTGEVVLLADVASAEPSIQTFVRRRAVTPSVSDLAGTWHLVIFGKAAGVAQCILATITLDGAGVSTSVFHTVNQNGTLTTPPATPVAATYGVTASGVVTLEWPLSLYAGRMTEDGEMVILSGSAVPGQEPAMAVMIRQSSFGSLGRFSGAYHFVGMSSAGAWSSTTGEMLSDGAGRLTLAGRVKAEGAGPVYTLPATTARYGVAADGTFSMTIDASGYELRGAISGNGKYMVLGGPVDPSGVAPYLWIGVRR